MFEQIRKTSSASPKPARGSNTLLPRKSPKPARVNGGEDGSDRHVSTSRADCCHSFRHSTRRQAKAQADPGPYSAHGGRPDSRRHGLRPVWRSPSRPLFDGIEVGDAPDGFVSDCGTLGLAHVDATAAHMGHAGDVADIAGSAEVLEPGITVRCPAMVCVQTMRTACIRPLYPAR